MCIRDRGDGGRGSGALRGAGGGAVVARGITWVGSTRWRSRSAPGSLMSDRASSPASRPIREGDCATVVRSNHCATGWSSKPTTDTCPGTSIRVARRVQITATATSSCSAKTAVGGSRSPSSLPTASAAPRLSPAGVATTRSSSNGMPASLRACR